MFNAPTLGLSVPDVGTFTVKLQPEVMTNLPAEVVLEVTPRDQQDDLFWQVPVQIMERPFWASAYVAISNGESRVLMSAMRAADDKAALLWHNDADLVRYKWSAYAKAAAQVAIEKHIPELLVSLFQPMKDAFSMPEAPHDIQ